MSDNRFEFGRVRENIRAMKEDLPVFLANQAQNYFVSSWKNQGFNGGKWKQVQRRTTGTKTYKYAKKAARTRAILVGSGALRAAVGNSIRARKFEEIKLVVDLPYAERHNKGLDGMPKRQFIGQTPELTTMQEKTIDKFIAKVWQQ